MKKILSIVLMITMLMSFCVSFSVSAADEIIITTDDAAAKLDGTSWTLSTSEKVLGPKGGNSWYTSNKTNFVQYSAKELEKGNYEVFVYTMIVGNTFPTVGVTISHSGKTSEASIDYSQVKPGDFWQSVGTYNFAGGSDSEFVKCQGITDGVHRAAAVKFVKKGDDAVITPSAGTTTTTTSSAPTTSETPSADVNVGDEIIITTDDSEAAFEGSGWKLSTSDKVLGPKGGNSWYASDKKCSIKYSAKELAAGNYEVFVYTIISGNTFPTVEVSVSHSDKISLTSIDYSKVKAGDFWQSVGTYNFAGGSDNEFVKCQGITDGIHRAAAVKFVRKADGEIETQNPQPSENLSANGKRVLADGEEYIMSCEDEGFSSEGHWILSGLQMVGDKKGYYTKSVGATATWKPNLEAAEGVVVSYFLVNVNSGEDNSLKIEVHADGKTSEDTLDFTVGQTGWVPIGTFNFSGDGTEYVKITKTTPDTNSRATLVKFSRGVEITEQYISAFKGTDKDILERIGMLIGEGNGITKEYIKTTPTRVQAAIMLLRLHGVDKEAQAFTGTDNFDDIGDVMWAAPYLAYLKAHPEYGMIGVGDNKFEPTQNIDAQAYAKILLESLGYSCGNDFAWEETLGFASSVGLDIKQSDTFTINDLAGATVSALNLNVKGATDLTLLKKLVISRDGINDPDYAEPKAFTDELKATRTEMKNRNRGIIYNNDGNDTYHYYDYYPAPFDVSSVTEEMTRENFLAERTYGVENTQIDSIFYCTGVFNSYHHRTSGETDVRQRDWSQILADTGMDSLETMIDWSRKNNKEIFWSMRMNDTHDYTYEFEHLDSWKQANLDKLMAGIGENVYLSYFRRWSAVDYTHNESRQKVYNILKDVCTRYDVDGIDIDLTGWCAYFKEVLQGEKIYPENIERMNDLFRSIRTMTEQEGIKRGKPILVSVLLPDSIDFCYEVGLDIETWLNEDLVDIITVGSTFRFQPWSASVEEYSKWDVPVYACFNFIEYIGYNDENIRGEVAQAWAEGVDGIYTYNIFDPNKDIFKWMGSAETAGEPLENYSPVRKTLAETSIKNGKELGLEAKWDIYNK